MAEQELNPITEQFILENKIQNDKENKNLRYFLDVTKKNTDKNVVGLRKAFERYYKRNVLYVSDIELANMQYQVAVMNLLGENERLYELFTKKQKEKTKTVKITGQILFPMPPITPELESIEKEFNDKLLERKNRYSKTDF